jgi:hypothetical protein
MEAILLHPPSAVNTAFHQPGETVHTLQLTLEKDNSLPITPLRLGPVFYAGRSPFRISVMILTCFAIPEHDTKDTGRYITYVGYKKAGDEEFDFDEMIHSDSFDMAEKTHDKACGFFGNSKLFVESLA